MVLKPHMFFLNLIGLLRPARGGEPFFFRAHTLELLDPFVFHAACFFHALWKRYVMKMAQFGVVWLRELSS